MHTYYHNTIPGHSDNYTLGYVSEAGEFIESEDFDDEIEINPIAEIFTVGGLLSAGESYEDFCARLARKITICHNYMLDADETGYVEVSSGAYLHTQENITADQKMWSDEDESKNFDFTTAPYWLCTDDGQDPIAIETLEDLVDEIRL